MALAIHCGCADPQGKLFTVGLYLKDRKCTTATSISSSLEAALTDLGPLKWQHNRK